MNEVILKKITNKNDIEVIFLNKKIKLPDQIQDKIEAYWNLINNNKNFIRGEVYTITNIKNINGKLKIYVELSDYAHYLYTINNSIPKQYACRVIYTAALVITQDSKFIFGEMSSSTSTPNRLQCSGGGIDSKDVRDNIIDLSHNISNELFEELGIDTKDTNVVEKIYPRYLKSGGINDFLAVIYKVDLKINEEEFKKIYNQHVETLKLSHKSPEFSSIIILPSTFSSVTSFINNDTRPRVDYLDKLIQLESK